MQGSLGGVQLIDLTPEGSTHKEVFSVGHDPLSDQSNNSSCTSASRMFHTTYEEPNHADNVSFFASDFKDKNFQSSQPDPNLTDTTKAFVFRLVEPKSYNHDTVSTLGTVLSSTIDDSNMGPTDDGIALTLRVASMKYTHSPNLLAEISSCVGEFRQYMETLASSIKHTAADIAIGIVHKKPELLTQSLYIDTSSRRRHFSEEPDIFTNTFDEEPVQETNFDIRLDIILQTPVIILPRRQSSPEVLVAHLGKIIIFNLEPNIHSEVSGFHFQPIKQDRIYVEVRDMNLYSKNVSVIEGCLEREDTTGECNVVFFTFTLLFQNPPFHNSFHMYSSYG